MMIFPSPRITSLRLLLALLFVTYFCHGQARNAFFVKADAFFAEKRYSEAARLYQVGLETDPQDVAAQYNCGLALFHSGNKWAAHSFFKSTYALHPDHDKFLTKYLGRTYQVRYAFDSAIAFFQHFEEELPKLEQQQQVAEKEYIDKHIAECETAKELVKKPKGVMVKNLGSAINSKFDDYSPAIAADEKLLMFTSNRKLSTADAKKALPEGTDYEEVLISDWQNDHWGPAHEIKGNVNGKKNDATVSISPDGQRLIVYKSSLATKGDLYYTHLVDSIWGEPVKFDGEINSAHYEPSAAINSSENTLIFSSDRPGGYGGLDLYISKLLPTGQWGKAENLGPTINTAYDEDAPFLQADEKTLHFSSAGHKGIGGYDIYTAVYNPSTFSWSTPENAGYPINTPDDDIYFNWTNSGSKAYFSSVRKEGLGGQDIYMLEFPQNDPPLVIVKGVVSDRITDSPLGTPIKVTVYTLDSNKVVSFYNASHATGKYILALPHDDTYGMHVEAEGYLLHSENITVPRSDDVVELSKPIELHPIEEGSSVVLYNVAFNYNKSTLQPQSEISLKAVKSFLKKNPDVVIEIGGHTDSLGSYQYNLKLSESRALVVKKELEKMGVEKQRLFSKGYSYSQPIATNKTEEGRSENRRTEFKVLSNRTTKPSKK